MSNMMIKNMKRAFSELGSLVVDHAFPSCFSIETIVSVKMLVLTNCASVGCAPVV